MKTANAFHRLPAKRRGFIRRASLWDGGEYLLSVSGTAFSERYRRFYYRDIKALVVRNGPRIGNIGLMLLLFFVGSIFAAFSIAPGALPVLRWLSWIPFVFICLLIYFDIARSCTVFIYTAVSSEELPALFRRSALKRVLPILLDKIHNAQGSFERPPAEADPVFGELRTAVAGPQLTDSKEVIQGSQPSRTGAFLFFTTMLVAAAFAYWYSAALLTPSSLVFAKVAFSILNVCGVGAGVWALMRVGATPLLKNIRNMIIAGLMMLSARGYALYFTLLAISVKHGILNESMLMLHWRHGLGVVDCAASTTMGISGLIMLVFTLQLQDRNAPVRGGSLSTP